MQLSDIRAVDPAAFDEAVAGAGLVVVYFWGPECPNCEIFMRDLPELVERIPPGVTVVKLNAYEHPDVARRFGIYGIPTFVLFRDGKKLGMMRQYYGKDYWSRVIDEQARGLTEGTTTVEAARGL